MDGASGPVVGIVIPVGPGDLAWRDLLAQLAAQLTPALEVILVATAPEPPDFAQFRPVTVMPSRWRWLIGPTGRAAQQNHGAASASSHFLWFLHADSGLEADALAVLWQRLSADSSALWYFDLHFLPDGPRLMWLNALGAQLRSRLLGMPFGDQGLALSRESFARLGGFREDARYGEDHLLVWAARRSGVRLRSVGRPIHTSARKYQQQGWLRTTLSHFRLTWKQAIPQYLAWLRRR